MLKGGRRNPKGRKQVCLRRLGRRGSARDKGFLVRQAGGGLCSRWQAQHMQGDRGEKQWVPLGKSHAGWLERGAQEEVE